MNNSQKERLKKLAKEIDSLQMMNADTSWIRLWETLGHTYKEISSVLNDSTRAAAKGGR